jgi:hypothetical protein
MGNTHRIVIVPIENENVSLLECLFRHLRSQKRAFSELHFWINTLDEYVVEVCCRLANAFGDWVKVVRPVKAIDGKRSLGQFYTYCTMSNFTYLRVCQDVVWMSGDCIENMFAARENDHTHFSLHSRVVGTVSDECTGDELVQCHQNLFDGKPIQEHEVEMICYTWHGQDMAHLQAENGAIDGVREKCSFEASCKPCSQFVDNAVCCLFAKRPFQRRELTNAGMLEKYKELAPKFEDDDLELKAKQDAWGHVFPKRV